MTLQKSSIASWIDRLADRMEQSAGQDQPLLLAYVAAARRAGYDADLLDRLWAAAAQDDAEGHGVAQELRAIAAEARRRHSA